MSKHKDFVEQKTILEEMVEKRGHICLFSEIPLRINPIERNWCHSKKEARKYANGNIVRLRQIIPNALKSVSIELI